MTEQRGLSKPVTCPRCPMHYENEEALLTHLKEKHNVDILVKSRLTIMEKHEREGMIL